MTRNRILHIAGHVALAGVLIPTFGFLFGWVVMTCWNATIPELFHLSAITFWQAVALLVLTRILVGRFTHGSHKRRSKGGSCGMCCKSSYRTWWRAEGKAAFKAFKAGRQGDPAEQG